MSKAVSRVSYADVKDRPHFSHSQLRAYQICSMRYYWKYVEGIREPKSSELALGSSIHRTIEFDYRHKMKSGRNEALSAKQDLFVEAFREEVRQGVLFPEWEKPEDVEKQGVELIKVHHAEVAVNANPVSVEKFIEVRIPHISVPIVGWIDVVEETESGRVIKDHKTSGRRYSEDAASFDLQLALYSAAEGIKSVAFDVFVKNKKPYIQKVPGEVSPLFRSYALGIYRQVYRCIEQGIFFPQAPGKWPCSPAWCYYWDRCVKRFGK